MREILGASCVGPLLPSTSFYATTSGWLVVFICSFMNCIALPVMPRGEATRREAAVSFILDQLVSIVPTQIIRGELDGVRVYPI